MKIISEIGSGATARVYYAVDNMGNNVALKLLTENADDDMKKRFRREVNYQREFSHPNIVHIIEASVDAEPYWYTMPLAAMNFLSFLRTLSGDQKITHSLPLLFNILDGLEVMHRRPIYHRDLKPANILLYTDLNGHYFAAITDFGQVTQLPDANSTKLTVLGMRGGTPTYRAPECVGNFDEAQATADIYSFGCILHDIYVGVKRVEHQKLTLNGPIGAVMERCTENDLRNRYQSIAELREALITATNDDIYINKIAALNGLIYRARNNQPFTVTEVLEHSYHICQDEQYKGDYYYLFAPHSIIQQLSSHPREYDILIEYYCRFMTRRKWTFESTDHLSSTARIMYGFGNEDQKALLAVSVLIMGLEHNRFKVMDDFTQMASVTIDKGLAMKIQNYIIKNGFGLEYLRFRLGNRLDDINPLALPRE